MLKNLQEIWLKVINLFFKEEAPLQSKSNKTKIFCFSISIALWLELQIFGKMQNSPKVSKNKWVLNLIKMGKSKSCPLEGFGLQVWKNKWEASQKESSKEQDLSLFSLTNFQDKKNTELTCKLTDNSSDILIQKALLSRNLTYRGQERLEYFEGFLWRCREGAAVDSFL